MILFIAYGCIAVALVLALIGAITANEGVCIVAGGIALIGFVLTAINLVAVLA